jgi:hypothetical protein
MYSTHDGHLLDLHGHKATTNSRNGKIRRIIALFALLLAFGGSEIQAQKGTFNYYNFQRGYYFGITLGFNSSRYLVRPHTSFIQNDSVLVMESLRGPGFNLGIVTNIEFGKNFDVRFLLPTISFAERQLYYKMTDRQEVVKKVESVFLEFPIHFRYKSAPYNDVRMFVVAGAKYSIDLASNSRARKAEDLVKVIPNDFIIEYGLGFQIFFPYFILSPEIKFSHGLLNIHDRNENLIYSSPIEKLFSRGFTLSLHFEG